MQGTLSPPQSNGATWLSVVEKIQTALEDYDLLPLNTPQLPNFINSFYIYLVSAYPELASLNYTDIISATIILVKTAMEKRNDLIDGLYRRIPKNIRPESLYTTPEDLVRAQVTKYTADQIRKLYHDDQLPAASQIGRQIVLTEEDVKFVLDREYNRRIGKKRLGGVEPGTRLDRGTEPFNQTP